MLVVLVLLVGLLAFANGSNDNCKGVATLVGFGAARPRQAMIWATVTTAAGSAISFWFAGGLIKSFSTGLFSAGTPLDPTFFVAVLAGAFGWVIFATLFGLPVSTTHAITGGLLGAGLTTFGTSPVRWAELGAKFALPLAASPLLSMSLVYLVAWPVLYVVQQYSGGCVCVVERPAAIATGPVTAAACTGDSLAVIADSVEECARQPVVAAVSTSAATTALHWFSSGMVGFARGWNDAPKVAALSVGALAGAQVTGGTALAFLVVTLGMAAGGLVAGRRVLETMAKKLTPLPLAESLTASLATASLVGMASWAGLPVSTTHVSTGAIIGAGLKNDARKVKWGKVGEVVLSWVVTLPVAGLMAAGIAVVLRYI